MKTKHIIVIAIFALLHSNFAYGSTGVHDSNYDLNRAKLLSYIIGKQISTNHYYHESINDKISRQAYKLYLKQVDSRKLFLLQKDVKVLDSYTLKLDDEMKSGHIQFPLVTGEILAARITQVEKMITDIAASEIDLDKPELLEIDTEKLDFCSTVAELKDRWRRNIKYQISSQYLDLQEIETAKEKVQTNKTEKTTKAPDAPPKTPEDLKKLAHDKVIKSNLDLLRRMQQWDQSDNIDRFFSIIAKAVDPHSSFMPPSQKEDFDIHMRGSLEGIGAVLQEEDGYVKVLRIIPGGAAYRQKQLHADDVILMVAQGNKETVDISGMKLRDAVSLIRGKKGSQVKLTIKKPDGSVIIIAIIRDVVQLEDTFVKAVVLPSSGSKYKFGYIQIPSFYRDFQGRGKNGGGRNVTDDVRKALQMLSHKNINGLVIDLRNNGGGALVDAVRIAGLFIDKGPVVQIKANEKITVLYDTDPGLAYSGPLIVMINRFSASASEIFAGAMQDYKRALVVGSEHSYGKGTVQTLINLDDNLPFFGLNLAKFKPLGALKLTTQKFYRINGGSTQDRGILADIVLPDSFKYAKIGEKYSENAMPWDKISPASYKKWPKFIYDIPSLEALNNKNISTNKKFIEISKEAQEAKKRLQRTLVNIDLQTLRAKRKKMAQIRKDGGEDSLESGDYHNDHYTAGQPDHEISKQEKEDNMIKQLHKDPAVQESLELLRASLS